MIKLIFTDSGSVMILKDVNSKVAKVSVPADAKEVKAIKKLLEKIWRYAQHGE